MNRYDFSYKIEDTFKMKTYQYLKQQNKEIADAFGNCIYEYQDMGLAYYVGLRNGDNWDKHALDFTIEGPKRSIKILERVKRVLKDAMEKALNPSKSGFLIREIFLFSNDEDILDLPKTNDERLNIDISIAEGVLKDLIDISGRLCCNSLYSSANTENSINDYFRDALSYKGYKEVKDQTRHGLSFSKKDAGEVDLLLERDGKEIAIFEGLKLDSVDSNYIDKHIKKAVDNYNVLGTAVFIVSYVTTSDYKVFWEKYYKYISTYDYNMECKQIMKERTYPNATTRIADIILSKNGYDFPVFFITINMPNKKI